MQADRDEVLIQHGSAIETRDDFFVEGAWDGTFSEGRFDESVTFMGTGGRCLQDSVIFSSPSHNLERCYTLKKNQSLFISNSFAFLMALSDEDLNPSYPFYYFDYIRSYRTGLRQTNHSLKTRSGLRVRLHDCHNIEVNQSLDIKRRLRNLGNPPKSFQSYYDFLINTTDKVFRNAADKTRRVRYRPLASISRGYDSPATSVLSQACGCQHTLTFAKSNASDSSRYLDDSGKPIAKQLGMDCLELDRVDLRDAPAELLKLHFQNPFGSIVSSMDQVSEVLKGSIFITGRHGEHYWSLEADRCLPGFQEPTARKTLVQNTLEFRLDRGYIDFHLPYTLGAFAPDLFKISTSEEMRKYSTGANGYYDRPIPRRIVESAGIDRKEFGQCKMGGAEDDKIKCSFSKEAREDFFSFYQDYVPPEIQLKQNEHQKGRFMFYEHGFAHGADRWFRKQYGLRTISEYVLGFRNHQRRHSPFLYTFHWGFEFVADRYRQVLTLNP